MKLARETFFTTEVLMKSTVTGKSGLVILDSDKIGAMQKDLRNKFYPDMEEGAKLQMVTFVSA